MKNQIYQGFFFISKSKKSINTGGNINHLLVKENAKDINVIVEGFILECWLLEQVTCTLISK